MSAPSNSDQNRSVGHHRTVHNHLQVINHLQIINHHLQQLHYNQDPVTDTLGNIWSKPGDISDLDWLIVKLNNRRLSQHRIYKALADEVPPIKLNHSNVGRHLANIKKRYKDLVRVDYAPSKPLSPGELGDLLKEVTKGLTGLGDSLGFGMGQDQDQDNERDTG
jgi:hypothetical protein